MPRRDDPINPPAVVRTAEDTEQQLINRARDAVSQSAWIVGECASKWTRKYGRGRTDADFGDKVGLDRQQVAQRRLVWDMFGKCYLNNTFPHLSWTHFLVALGWDDAETYLQWANDRGASVAAMRRHWQTQTEPPPQTGPPPQTEPDDRGGPNEPAEGEAEADEGGAVLPFTRDPARGRSKPATRSKPLPVGRARRGPTMPTLKPVKSSLLQPVSSQVLADVVVTDEARDLCVIIRDRLERCQRVMTESNRFRFDVDMIKKTIQDLYDLAVLGAEAQPHKPQTSDHSP
jgi:hypothetical protein